MQCPKCNHIQEDGHLDCMRCGIVFSKFRERQSSMTPPRPQAMTATAGAIAASPSMPISSTSPNKKMGLFSAVPCPNCGGDTQAQSDTSGKNNVAAEYFGIGGALVAHAFTAKYHCQECGLIDFCEFPAAHRNLIYIRKVILMGSGVGIFCFLVWLLLKLEGL